MPATAVGVLGTAGAPGLTDADAADTPEVPSLLVAVEVNVYEVPLVRPVTVHEVAGTVTVHVPPPGDAVTVYEVGVPPLPATTVTVACPAPTTTVGVPGVPGGGPATGCTPLEGVEYVLLPMAFIAATWKVYVVPLVRPETVHEVEVEVGADVAQVPEVTFA